MNMKKKLKFFTLPILALVLVLLTACGGAENTDQTDATSDDDSGEVVTLKMAGVVSEIDDIYKHAEIFFIEKVEELSDGKVEIDFYPNQQLGAPTDMVNLLNSGMTDIATVASSYSPGKLPLGNAFQLPNALPNAEIGGKAYWD